MLLNIFLRDIGQTILFLSSIFLLSIVPTKNRWENFFLPMAVLFFSGYVSNFIRFSSFWEATIKLEQEERPQPLQPSRPCFPSWMDHIRYRNQWFSFTTSHLLRISPILFPTRFYIKTNLVLCEKSWITKRFGNNFL